jgi:ubiquinone/menaquinone biosynthesis C-methylase UbiE
MDEPPERTAPPPPLPVRAIGKGITRLVARFPRTWPVLRPLVTRFFDNLAPVWDERVKPDAPEHLAALVEPVDRIQAPPARALDLGTGTGAGALWLARRFPEAKVTGVDISEPMIEKARAKLPDDLAGRVVFQVADADRLPFGDGSFDLVTQISVPVFFDEVSRVLAPGGHVIVVSSLGAKTPFHTPEATVRKRFASRGVETLATGSAGQGTFLLGRRSG